MRILGKIDMPKWFNLIILLGAVLFGAVLASIAAESQNTQIKIDGNLPLTGPIAAFCGEYPNAFSMGVADACKQYSIPNDRFKIDFQDNGGKPPQAVSVVRKQLLSSPPAIYISGTSPVSLAIAHDITELGIPHLLGHDGPNRLRILTSHKIEAPRYIEEAKRLKAKKVLIIALNIISYNNEFGKIVEPAFAAAGIECSRESYNFDTKDFRTIALRAAQYKPDLILVAGHSVHVYPILGALREYNLIKKDNVLCLLDFIDLLHNKTPKSDLVGVPFIAPPYEISTSPAKKDWVNRFEASYHKGPSYVEAYAYDAGRIMVTAFKRYGKVDAQSIRKVLPFKGICGEISIDQDGDLNTKLLVAQVMPDSTVKAIK